MDNTYKGYFETGDGQYWIFIYDYQAHTSTVVSGMNEWAASDLMLKVVGAPPDVLLWVNACYNAAISRIDYPAPLEQE